MVLLHFLTWFCSYICLMCGLCFFTGLVSYPQHLFLVFEGHANIFKVSSRCVICYSISFLTPSNRQWSNNVFYLWLKQASSGINSIKLPCSAFGKVHLREKKIWHFSQCWMTFTFLRQEEVELYFLLCRSFFDWLWAFMHIYLFVH